MFEVKQIYIGLAYDIGDGFIDHAFTEGFILIKNLDYRNIWDEEWEQNVVKHNPEVFVRLK